MSTFGTARHHQNSTGVVSTKERATDYHTTLFRRLVWEGTVPLEVRVDPKELPANSDRGLECYYIQAPRVSYLPLLMPEIRRFLMDVVFDEAAAQVLKEDEWWFESAEGALLKWHWPIGLIYDNHTISASVRLSSSQPTSPPMRLVLHLASPPAEKLLQSPSAESCKHAFMGQLKEADFMRWGNTKRMTGLRKVDQDGIWEGIKDHSFDHYWRVASKITPIAGPIHPQSPIPPPSASLHSRPPSADPGPSDRDGAYSVRSVPVRIYLPDGPVLQDLVPPLLEDGSSNTLAHFLTTHIPLLFPPRSPPSTPTRNNPSSPGSLDSDLAYALIQGVQSPPDAEMAWLGACMAGADGWLNVCIGIKNTPVS